MRRGCQRFRADERIAVGATAVLWRGRDLELDRPVAIKRPHPHLVDDEETRARFLREARNAARLAHPNVVRIFDVGVDDEGPWIAMELAEGESLAAHLQRNGPLPALEAAQIGVQIAAALSHAHRIPVVHRDVKPSNVIIDAAGSIRLVDFGLARLADDGTLTATGLIAGTPTYMAPELIRGTPASPASDVYALGVVLYELLTGSPPFTGNNPLAVALAHEREDPSPLSAGHAVPPAMERLVTRCMNKDPTRRPTSGSLEIGLEELAGPNAVARTIGLPVDDAETNVRSGAAVTTGLPQGHGPAPRRGALALAAVSAAAVATLGVALATRGGTSQDLGLRTDSTARSTTVAAPSEGTATPTAPSPPAPAPAPAKAGDLGGRSDAARRVAELIGIAASTGAISDGRASKLEEQLRDAEEANLGGDADQSAKELVRLVRDSSRGRIRDSSLAADLGGAIRTLAASWGIDVGSEEDEGNSGHGDGDDDGP